MKNRLSLQDIVLGLLVIAFSASCQPTATQYREWRAYGGSPEMNRYSALNQIDTSNVANLQLAWTYHSGDADTLHHSQMQCNPIMVDGIVYGVNPKMKLFAIDAATGVKRWQFDPNSKSGFENDPAAYHNMINSRGIAYWSDGKKDHRIFFTAGSNTFAIDAQNGKPITSFGKNGSIDLHDGLGRDVSKLFVVNTSPGMIYRDLLILGTRVDEALPSAPGHIRAFDTRTGKQVWIFHSIPQPGEYGYDTWADSSNYNYIGGANAWSGFALDAEQGILYVPTGSAAYDFYGANRKGANLFANCLIALDAASGNRKWHFQFVHHDVWDKDLPTPPALVTLNRNGKKIDAVAQPTKQGLLFVFDRNTGKPLFEIEERPIDTAGALPGEQLWPTQPFPLLPKPFSRQSLTENDINPYLDDTTRQQLQQKMAGFRYGKPFLPPGEQTSLVFPGYDGGAEWGGPAVDQETGILYINSNEMAWEMTMKASAPAPTVKENNVTAGKRLYNNYCATCHGADRKGTGNNPTLINSKASYQTKSFLQLLNTGRRMMPAFKQISEADKAAIASYVLEQRYEQQQPYQAALRDTNSIPEMRYKMTGYTKFLAPDGRPAISPPWGTLSAINLNTGETNWKINLGEVPELKARGLPPTGTENYGGPVVTAGGLVIIAATRDSRIRAFHKRTGALLWEYELPAPGFATAATYEWNHKQYIVIACGGGKLGTRSGDAYLAFALPGQK